MKIAIIHDWLVTYAGAEKVLEQILLCYPEADVFTTIDLLDEKQRSFLKGRPVYCTWLQKLPKWLKRRYQKLLPLMPLAIEQLNLSDYDVIVSGSHAVAKGVITGPNQLHISYIHTPIRYAWDMQSQYLKNAGLESGIKSYAARVILHYMRIWDIRTSFGVDYFVANSGFIAQRVMKTYRRPADVIYPPVDIEKFKPAEELVESEYYLTVSRLVPYKNIELIVRSFTELPNQRLVVIGDGPGYQRIQEIARGHDNIQILGYQSDEVMRDYLQRAKAFVFAAEEDFGIVVVEAQAAGTPVIAYGKGGARETVLEAGKHQEPTGLFFEEETTSSLIAAIQRFEKLQEPILSRHCQQNAERFAIQRFREEFQNYIETAYNKFLNYPIV